VFGFESAVMSRVFIYVFVVFVDDVVDELGSRHAINYVQKILEQGTGADRQLAIYDQTQNLKTVVDYINSQFLIH
jgi:carboxylate-amine ligase